MNRLAAQEANTTLYARYVEEQIAGVREMLRRVSEDVGRLEGIVRVSHVKPDNEVSNKVFPSSDIGESTSTDVSAFGLGLRTAAATYGTRTFGASI